ncbi:inhibitor of nuclear factor kappa-B kinase-interacting protein isoform X1 [Alligator mississippiensis]|uniref:inhibitor of nuclear factor kappa-B kinase-interacting protein isoform X1 n=1 Tax=Alligator mississippiensis TaxID=8496 RepID=UPI002877DECC|nr:inhibitor of nuclear factor kappa-B kinase-interacting protein isoform X1 [Alligator mississippiensis]XP_014450611.2 inhibitor of nuclear factor kappa-B kinase-interacting protein isoform X1 [Alligator mississippiensis]XP_014450618.2 inhibitor of nuclear factor kappa-B kinase-interacting protein isoform X1 [Alligator mississippiensis]
MSELKQRKKVSPSPKLSEDLHMAEKQSSHGEPSGPRNNNSQSSFPRNSQTALSLLSLLFCIVLSWFLFQQSSQFAVMEKKYHLLQLEVAKFLDVENEVNLLSQKLESSESILQETTSSISVVTQLEQDVSTLRNIIHDIQNTDQTLSKEMQRLNEKFQNVSDSWKRSLDEMNANTSSLKSEAKLIHTEVTSQINAVDQRIKFLTEGVKDLEDSTARNIKTIQRQEEDELSKVEEQLDFHTKAVEKLEEQQSSLLAKDTDMSQKLTDYEPKVTECKTHLPTIENAVHSILRVSSELLGMEKKMEDLATQMFTMEDGMLKTVSDIVEMQKILEGMQYDNSILKLQNDIVILKERVHDIMVSSNTGKKTSEKYDLESELILDDE